MARPISDLAKNDQIAFSEIDFSEDPDQETELYSTENPTMVGSCRTRTITLFRRTLTFLPSLPRTAKK